MFRDREEAARRLADELAPYTGTNPLVLGVPRGGVPMAKIVAERLGGEFDVVLVHKLRAPGQPEYGIGAIDESGWAFIAPYAASTGADEAYLEQEKRYQLETIRERRAQYSPLRPAIDPGGRTVIVVDDGLATGSTMRAALHGLREHAPARLVCAVPVAPPDTVRRMRGYADEVVCLLEPKNFRAVGQFYEDFDQVEDEEVIALLGG